MNNKAGNDKEYLLVGTYTSGSNDSIVRDSGIYIFQFDTITSSLEYLGSSPVTSNPSYLALSSDNQFLYAVNENNTGEVSAFHFDNKDAKLKFLNKVGSNGSNPCYISLSGNNKFVLVANYSSGTVATYPVDIDGKLGEAVSVIQHSGKGIVPARQEGPHAHMILQAPGTNLVLATDLGTDKVEIYDLDTLTGNLANTGRFIRLTPGAGPRHFAFHPGKNWLYIVNELNGTIESFTFDKGLTNISNLQIISTMPAGDSSFAGSADIHISSDGLFLYASNRGTSNTLAIYRIDPATGLLTLSGHNSTGGKTPRNFAIDPSGKFLLVGNQNSNSIVIFRINKGTGLPEETGHVVNVPAPVCLKFLNIN